jgi:murein DD-endopeptidase MepM/ murein hydrolase activator NlpD
MRERFTTIFIVSNDDRDTKFYTVKTKHVERFRKYSVISLSALSTILVTSLILFFMISSAKNEIGSLNQKIYGLKNDLKLLDSLEIKKKVDNIENNINDINKYLNERGMFKSENSGGPEDTGGIKDLSIYEYYLNKTDLILKTIKNVPIGNPHIGEFKSYFGYRSNPFSGRGSEFHKGLDIKGNIGDPVKCTAGGTVEKAEYDGGYGKCIVINHGNGLRSVFGHLSEFNVKQGDKVNAGDLIGFVGSTGRSTGPHLHYEIRYKEESINPQYFLNIKNQ